MNMALVSIITPVYNAARWLPGTLASVRAQTLTDWEHILVDDGSTDDSLAIIESAATNDVRFRSLPTSHKGCLAVLRNLALDVACGRYIAFIDADDLWLPQKLARSIEWMTRHGYGFIYHDYRHFFTDGRIGALVSGPEELTLRAQHTNHGVNCVGVVIDREQIPDFRFREGLYSYQNEDFIAWMSLLQRGYTGHRFPADLGRYRLSKESLGANKFAAARRTWRVYRDLSKLPFPRAVSWWLQYAWSGCWFHLYARPR
jgi:teichuronic acid biosynthesis glycosyltransferase TuaG